MLTPSPQSNNLQENTGAPSVNNEPAVISNWLNKLVLSRFFIPIALLVAFFVGLGSIPLVDLDEGAFGSATMEMLIRKDYITTYLGGQLRFDKPILIYWLQAFSVSIFGLNEWGLRIPSAIMSVLWSVLIFTFSFNQFKKAPPNKLTPHSPEALVYARIGATVAVVAMSASLYIVVVGRAAIADALLNFWLCLTMLSGFLFFNTGERKYIYFGYIGMGFGLLTKGPIAVMIPVVVSSLFLAVRFLSLKYYSSSSTKPITNVDEQKKYVQRYIQLAIAPTGWIIALAIALPWYILEYLEQGQLFIDGFILKHNISRFDSAMEGHTGSIFYYVTLLPLLILPSTGLLLFTLKKLPNLLKSDFDCWMWIWFLFVLVFFSFSGTKLPHYVLYGCTPLFILIGKYHHEFTTSKITQRLLVFLPIALWLCLLLALPTLLLSTAEDQKNKFLLTMFNDSVYYLPELYYIFICFLLLIVIFFIFKFTDIIKSWLVVAVLHSLLLVTTVLPFIMNSKQDAIKQAGLIAKKHTEPAVIDSTEFRTFGIYRGRVTPVAEPKAGELFLTDEDYLEKYLSEFSQSEILYRRSGFVLLKLAKQTDNTKS